MRAILQPIPQLHNGTAITAYLFSEACLMFRIPSGLQQMIPPAAAKKVMELLHQPALTQAVKDAAQKIGWPDIQAPGQIQEIWQQAKQWMESTLHSNDQTVPISSAVINGTGKIFHSTLGGVPLPLGIADQAARLMSYMMTQSIEETLRETLCNRTGAEDALVVVSVEHAISLLNYLPQAADGWLVPRGDYVSWSADAHIGNCLDTATRPSIPVGSITHCSEKDLLQSLKGSHHGVLRLSPDSMIHSTSPNAGTQSTDLRQIQTPARTIFAELLLNGTWLDLQTSTFPFVQVSQRLQSGTSLVILPGDRLIGGPACGIIVGARSCIAPLREAAQKQRLRIHPLIACMLQLIAAKQTDRLSWQQQPVGAMLSNSLANLKDRAKRLEFQIQGCEQVENCQMVESLEPIGDYAWSNYTLPGMALQITLKGLEEWSERIQREKGVSVIGDREGNKLTLHLRSIDPADDRLLADLFPCASIQRSNPEA